MQNKKVCEIEGCKANLEHREGAHSNWCPKFGTRVRYVLTYCKTQEDWDNGNYDRKSFSSLKEAMDWGRKNEPTFHCGGGFQVERTEEKYKYPPAGMQWRKEEYAWEETDQERTLVYDGNSEYEVTNDGLPPTAKAVGIRPTIL